MALAVFEKLGRAVLRSDASARAGAGTLVVEAHRFATGAYACRIPYGDRALRGTFTVAR